jgi:hypothetical protein
LWRSLGGVGEASALPDRVAVNTGAAMDLALR